MIILVFSIFYFFSLNIKMSEKRLRFNNIKLWDVIEDKLGIKFYSEPVSEYKYLKAKVREFDGMIKTNFLGNDIPKENMHYTCIACITIDSVLKIDKKNDPQIYLEE